MGTQLPATKRGRATPTFAYVYCGQMVAHPSYCWALVLDKPGSVGSPLGPPSVPEENLSGLVKWVFLQAGCPSRHPITSVKALKGKQCTNPNPGLSLASFTTRLLMERVLLPLCRLSDASTTCFYTYGTTVCFFTVCLFIAQLLQLHATDWTGWPHLGSSL